MNNRVQKFIGLWKEKQSLNALMESDFTASDAEELRSELMNMNSEQRVEAEEILKSVSNLLVERVEALKDKRIQIHKELEQSRKTKSACLAYQRQKQNSPDHREEMVEYTARKMEKIQKREESLRENLRSVERNTKE
jgi:hypothetical protein